MPVRREYADGGHELDGLQHDVRQRRRERPGDQRHRLLVLEDVFQPNLVVHDGLQAPDALVLDLLPFAVAGIRTKNENVNISKIIVGK